MALSQYYLVLVLRVAGSDTGTIPQTWNLTAETADEAVTLAKHYLDRIPTQALCSATLAEASGKVVWSMQNRSMKPDEPSGPRQRDGSA